ncbi:MAG: hypothetical protein LBV08_10480 [Clostridiales bacterium]|jgi:hypothetical protein|nr:hypothetical protein [Clostridiales bacterium]
MRGCEVVAMKNILIIDKAKNASREVFEKVIDKSEDVHYYLYVNYPEDIYLKFNNTSVTRINNILNIFKKKFDIIVFISYTIKGLRFTSRALISFLLLKPKIFCQNLSGELFEIRRVKIFYLALVYYSQKLLWFLFTLPLTILIYFFKFLFFIKQSVCNLLSKHINIFKKSKDTN